MSAQAKPIITAPLPAQPIPFERWKPGQTIGQFVAELQRTFWLIDTCDGVRLVRKH